jgi:ABC-type multidrug transport system fused ATPase/permease subunit
LKEAPVQTFLQILGLGRGRLRSFFVVAVMVSVGTGATLCEPWIYRAIIDDIAGVFVPSPAVVEVETAIENAARSVEHWSGALDRILSIPMAPFEVTDSNRRTLDARHPHEAAATIILGAILLVVIRLVAEAFKRLADNRATSLAIDLERDFILRTFKHVIYLPLTFFSKRASGVVARQIDQSDNVAPIFTAMAKELWPDLFRLLAILAIMLTVNYELALVATLTVLLYGVISWRLTRVIERDAEQYYGLWDEVASRVQQAIAGIKTVRTHSTEQYEETRIHQAASDAYSSYMRRTRAENRYSYLQDGVISLSKACVLGVGGLKAIEHQLTPGDVVMFLAYLDRLYAPIEGLTSLYTALQQHVISVRRAQRLLEEPVTGDESRPSLQVAEGTVRFENVHFAYSPDRPVLDGVSFELRAGQRTALIGPSGAGKTTVTDLLTALYRPQDGEIFIDNQPLSQVSPPSIRSAVRGVAADEMIFRMSIGENIRYGRHNASLDEVREAVRLAGLAPVIERLPEGLDTVIGEQGVELSLGERQRVLLARAFVARPLILILDEATANLDFRTEASVKHALEVISKGRTTLIVAHRRSMLTSVDRVLVLRGGKIEQDGTPADLMTREGYFRDMMSADEHSAA